MDNINHLTCKRCGVAFGFFKKVDYCYQCSLEIERENILNEVRMESKKEDTRYVAKKDKGKLPWDLVPWKQISYLVEVLQMGAEKYGRNTWQNLPSSPDGQTPSERYQAALFRHLTAWCSGEKKDPESGLSHLAHVLANVVFMLYFEDKEDAE